MDETFIIDYQESEVINNNLNYYLKEEKLTNSDFDNIYSEIKEIYKTSNNDLLDRLETEIIMNLKTMATNHENNIVLIDKRIERVKRGITKAKEIDENFKGGIIHERN